MKQIENLLRGINYPNSDIDCIMDCIRILCQEIEDLNIKIDKVEKDIEDKLEKIEDKIG
jgi:peptidoglycan hydrolase CwlO-like protein